MKSIAQQDIFGEFDTEAQLHEGMARPANLRALDYAEAVCKMLQARMSLEMAKCNVPSYTGNLRAEDYYQAEQEVYNRACEELYEIACRSFHNLDICQ